jgi:hypothetical protein
MKGPPHTIAPLLLTALLAPVAAGYAQSVWTGQFEGYFGGTRPRFATPASFDGSFHFCRLMYRSGRREAGGSGWSTDYPGADFNFSIRFSELTKATVGRTRSNDPDHLVVRVIDDDALFQCPFVTLEDAGTAVFSEVEAQQLRTYLRKGGFIWADDFWGTRAWSVWANEIAKVLPPAEYPIVDVPVAHAMFHTLYDVKRIPQVPSIQSWRRLGDSTSERGADSAEIHVRGIFDEGGRLMVLMTHNTDISDTWEREGEDPEYFYRFSPEGYAVAINVMLYVMTH